MLHRTGHQHRVLRFGNRGVHQHTIAAQFHRDGGIAGSADTGIDDDRHLGVLDDRKDVVAILDAEAGADRGGQRHHGAAANLFQPLGQYRVITAIDHHVEAFLDQRFGGGQRADHVRVQGLRIGQHFELDQLAAIQQFTGQPAGAHGVLRRVAAGGVRQDRVTAGRHGIQQAGLARVLPDVHTANSHGDDFGAAGFGGQTRFVEALVLAAADQQARGIAVAGDHERIVSGGQQRFSLGHLESRCVATKALSPRERVG